MGGASTHCVVHTVFTEVIQNGSGTTIEVVYVGLWFSFHLLSLNLASLSALCCLVCG